MSLTGQTAVIKKSCNNDSCNNDRYSAETALSDDYITNRKPFII